MRTGLVAEGSMSRARRLTAVVGRFPQGPGAQGHEYRCHGSFSTPHGSRLSVNANAVVQGALGAARTIHKGPRIAIPAAGNALLSRKVTEVVDARNQLGARQVRLPGHEAPPTPRAAAED